MIPIEWIHKAHKRLDPHIKITPLTYDPERQIYIKWENHQITGSFKARGALNKAYSLHPWEQNLGFAAASAGNHGQGVALAARKLGCTAKIFASVNADESKLQAMRKLGAELVLISGGYADAEAAGLTYARQNDTIWISPYNDGQVIAGQGTIALEVLQQQRDADTIPWVVPVGGGGLISGIGSALKFAAPKSKVIGVQSTASPYFFALYHTNTQKQVLEKPSIADGLAGPVESGSITIPIVKNTVNEMLLVTENEIASAIVYAWKHYGERIEGSGAVPLAAVLAGKIETRPLVLIISGGNILDRTFRALLKTHSDNG